MKFSWDLIQTFHGVAKEGSLLAASRSLGLSQPTVGRHIDMLEAALNVTLFVRSRDGMALTEAGANLVDASAEMVSSAAAFSRKATGLDAELSGTVRISVNDVLGIYVLPGILTDFLEENPDIDVELDISNSAANLSRRDADIALRMFRPTQNDLVARKVTDISLGFFASDTYLKKHGRPQSFDALREHRLIGFDRETLHIDAAKALGITISADDFAFRSDNIVAQIEVVKSGLGIGILHRQLTSQLEGIEQVMQGVSLPAVPLWIACHMEVRHNRRIRLLVDFLAERLRYAYAQDCNGS
jgi:DNA-binding transcriptional LysR family regulator